MRQASYTSKHQQHQEHARSLSASESHTHSWGWAPGGRLRRHLGLGRQRARHLLWPGWDAVILVPLHRPLFICGRLGLLLQLRLEVLLGTGSGSTSCCSCCSATFLTLSLKLPFGDRDLLGGGGGVMGVCCEGAGTGGGTGGKGTSFGQLLGITKGRVAPMQAPALASSS